MYGIFNIFNLILQFFVSLELTMYFFGLCIVMACFGLVRRMGHI